MRARDAGFRQRGKRREFATAHKAEQEYARSLRKIARHVGDIIRAFPAGDPEALTQIERALGRYSEVIAPWAEAVAGRMLEDVAKRDEKEWVGYSREMGIALRREIREAPTGALLHKRLAEQVHLITSLPREAAERVHKLTIEGLANGTRASETAAEIMRSGEVTASRATLIARTETARTASMLTTARAQHIGCTHFRWVAVKDSRTRDSHRKMDGKICEFANPPVVDGEPLIPGQIYNCRCTLLPILPEPAL